MQLNKLINDLYQHGLGDLLILHIVNNKVILGNITYNKGKLTFKDRNYLPDFNPADLKPCWENGMIGMVSKSSGHEWESLTFYGLEYCNIPVDLSSTRHGLLVAAENQFGDKLIDFVGSIYRGYQLMLDRHFLPVILFKEMSVKSGETGLIVTDLRTVRMKISLIRTIHDVVRESIADHLQVNISDADLNTMEFQNLFGDFMSRK